MDKSNNSIKSRWFSPLGSIVGILLLSASFLKAEASTLMPWHWSNIDDIFRLLQITLEGSIGAAFCLSIAGSGVRKLVLILFVAFLGYAIFLIFNDADNCGCFGRMKVHPVFLLVVDSLVVAFLWCTRKSPKKDLSTKWKFGAVLFCIALGGTLGWWSTTYTALAPTGNQIIDSDQIVEISTRTLNIGDFLDLRTLLEDSHDSLVSEDRVFVFFRHDCQACLQHIDDYERLAMLLKRKGKLPIVLVEVPPASAVKRFVLRAPVDSDYRQLSTRHQWFVRTPLLILLRNGHIAWIGDESMPIEDLIEEL